MRWPERGRGMSAALNTMRRYPPGPTNYNAAIGLTWRHAAALWWDPLRFVDRLRRYGDLAFFRAFGYRIYVANHPQLIREVLITRRDAFRKTPRDTRAVRQLLGNGVLVSEGDDWLRQRRLLQKAFHPSRMDGYAAAVVDQTLRTVHGWQIGETVDVAEAMTDLTLRIAAKTMFGVDVGDRTEELARAARILSEQFAHEMRVFFTPPHWLPSSRRRRKRWAMDVCDRFLRDTIAHRRQSGEDRDDLLSLLLSAVEDEGNGGLTRCRVGLNPPYYSPAYGGMTDVQARDEAMTLFVAAFHAASMGLTWTWHVLSEHPQVARRLRAEVLGVLEGRAPTLGDLADLPYTQMVVKESLRLFPPAWGLFCRQAVQDVELGGYALRRGAWVYVWPYLTHRDGRFFPDPLRFDPERFSPEREPEIPQGAYFPFGLGPRACIGESFAMTELPLVVATIAQQFRLHHDVRGGPVRAEALLSLRPRGGLPMRILATPCRARALSP